MGEDGSEAGKVQETSLSRRDFLKLSALAGAAAGVAALSQTKPGKELEKLTLYLIGPNPERISSEVPSELLSKEIPIKNEFYRPPLAILNEGISLYNGWRQDETSLPEIYYIKPPNYFDEVKMANFLAEGINRDSFENRLLVNDQPDHSTIDFSIRPIGDFNDVVLKNPGTGLVRQIREKYKQEFKRDFDLSTDDQEQFLKTHCLSWFENAKKFIEREVDKRGKQSTSLLFAYFLYRDKGNLGESLWDTTMWLKLIARNNPKTWTYEPTRQEAELLTKMFKDEFSLSISANWVSENVPSDSATLNSAQTDKDMQYKDFMPINRVGGFYHAWNTMALSTSVLPFVLKIFVSAHYSDLMQKINHSENSFSPDGREKIRAGLKVLTYTSEISRLVQSYRKEH